jgi:branched-chain amino acid transport system ATP-binding protein
MSVLTLKGISQEFGGLRALDSIDLEIRAGEIFGIIGPNGAGKTTLFNIITGIYYATEGDYFFNNQLMKRVPPYRAARMGIARTYQNIRLFNKLSVLDNVRVGLRLPAAKKEEQTIKERSLHLLEMVGLYEKRGEYADNLAYGEQRKLEIARALAGSPVLLLLDEPAAGMNSTEKVELVDLIRGIRDQMELTILLVEHDMNLVMNICERIAVLNYGRKIAEGAPDQIKSNSEVIESYLGVET